MDEAANNNAEEAENDAVVSDDVCDIAPFFTPMISECRADITSKVLKGEDEGWVLVTICQATYEPVFDLEGDDYVNQGKKIKFGIRKKQRGPARYDTPSVENLLDLYLPEELMEVFVDNSNDYSKKRKENEPTLSLWKSPSSKVMKLSEMYQFFACIYYMGLVKLNAKTDYWRNDGFWPYHPIMHDMSMTRDRFAFVWRHFHLSPVDIATVRREEESLTTPNVMEEECNEIGPNDAVTRHTHESFRRVLNDDVNEIDEDDHNVNDDLREYQKNETMF